MPRYRWTGVAVVGIAICMWGGVTAAPAPGQPAPEMPTADQPKKKPSRSLADLAAPRRTEIEAALPKAPPSILPPALTPIDLASALRLAGVENPQILIARQRVAEANALRAFAMAQVLPNINAGLNYDAHVGNLQQSNGNILKVNRDALYAGLGAGAIAAGTVNIPGITYNMNVSQAVFGFLTVRQLVRQREFESIAVRNDMLLRVATAYVELLRAEGQRAIAIRNSQDAYEVARLTTAHYFAGEGKKSDADRAATELSQRNDLIMEAESQVLTASARLAQLLNLDPSNPLGVVDDGWIVPAPIVPDPAPLHDLIGIALGRRPELAAQRAAIQEAFLTLQGAKLLPFSPNVLAGFSAGTFGGGSNLIARPGGFNGVTGPRFDNFGGRTDVDIVVYWTAQNFGLGNLAQVRLARANLGTSQLQLLVILNQVRAEVATAYARTHARYRQIDIGLQAVRSGELSFHEDLERINNLQGLPIELLESFRLLARARMQYLDAVTEYNRAQFELYVALGQPPADSLARPVPVNLVQPPTPVGEAQPGCPPPAVALPASPPRAPTPPAARPEEGPRPRPLPDAGKEEGPEVRP